MIVKIDDYDYYGRGICKIDGKVCFVNNALLDEEVDIKITKNNKKYMVASINEVITKSKYRVDGLCKYYGTCGGCDLLHVVYSHQLEMKEKIFLDLFNYNDINNYKYLGIEYDKQFNYRNKASFHSNGSSFGFYKKGSNDIIEIDKCLLVDAVINDKIKELKKDNDTFIRVSNVSDDYSTSKKEKELQMKIGEYTFLVNNNSFFQVNNNVTYKLYSYIYSIVKEINPIRVIDLFCGVGTIGIFISSLVKKVIGIEIIDDAIDMAKKNMKLNNIKNIEFISSDSSYIENITLNEDDLVIVDPPRSGLNKKTSSTILNSNAKTVIYVSCNKTTLIRDLKILTKNYQLVSVKLFDMFPNTFHVECVCVLERMILKK